MATLIATYCRAFPNTFGAQVAAVAVGAGARSEEITIPATGALVTVPGETVVVLLADDDCWVAVGPDPDTAEVDGARVAWPVPAGIPYPLLVAPGDKVKVVTR